MNKLKDSISMLWSNDALLHANKIPLLLALLIFFINVSLVSVPNYFGLLDGVRSIDRIVGIEATLTLIYDAELDCRVDEFAEMTCGTIPSSINGYRLIAQDEINTEGITESTILFGKTQTAIVYVDDTDTAYLLAGDYRLLTGFDFAAVKTLEHDFDTLSEHYASVTDFYLSSVYFSAIGEQLLLVFASQFSQMAIYLIIISIMFQVLNYRTKIKKISYKGGLKIIILSMLGPALLTAVLGVFFTAWAAMLFIFLFAIRILFVYYKINKTKETIY
jgi:hypothetical protein